jgi:hypothetical protein
MFLPGATALGSVIHEKRKKYAVLNWAKFSKNREIGLGRSGAAAEKPPHARRCKTLLSIGSASAIIPP